MSRAHPGCRKIWIPLCALALGGAAAAQPDTSALEACAAITDRADRLDCYDRIAAGASAAEAAPPAASAPERRAETATAPATPRQTEATAAPPSPQRAEPPAAPASERRPEAPAAAAGAPAAPAPGSAETASSGVSDESDGAAEVADEDLPTLRAEGRRRARSESGTAVVSILVVQRVENISGLSVFVTDDGTIFDQISVRAGRYPDTPFLAEIEPASKNSYWLRTARKSPPVRVIERD